MDALLLKKIFTALWFFLSPKDKRLIQSIILNDSSNPKGDLFSKASNKLVGINVLNVFVKMRECISFLSMNKIDIIFADISFVKRKEFGLFKKNLDAAEIEIVFLISKGEMTCGVLNISALYFIETPFLLSEIERVIDKFENKKTPLNIFLEHQRISIPVNDGWEIIEIDKIVYFQADSNYTDLFLSDGSRRKTSKPLKHYAKLLSRKNFIRIHQSFLVNPMFMRKLSKDKAPSLVLYNNLELPVSRSGKKELRRLFLT